MILEHLDKQTADGTAQNLGKLYQLFPSCFTESADAEGNVKRAIRYATRTQLNWTHLRSLMGIKDPLERQFYAQMCSAEHWDTRIPGTLRHYLCSQKQ